MTASTKDITFPHKELSKLGQDAEPTATEVCLPQQEVCANAASVGTTLGGGNHGHLGMFMPDAECQALGGPPPNALPQFQAPPRPVVPNYAGPAGQVATDRENYENALGVHITCNVANINNKDQKC